MCSEIEIENLERQFIAKSCSAFAAAYKRARAAGLTVIVSQGGIICRILPDGRREPIKRSEEQILVEPGQKVYFGEKD